MKIERAKLESLIAPLIDRCRGPVRQAIKDATAKLGSEVKIDRVVLVGGPTRMPVVQQFLEKEVGQKIEGGIDPMECVALGAAIQGAIITGDAKEVLLLDVTPLSLGIETMGQVFTKLIDRNTTIPTKKSQIFSTAEENQTAVTIRVLQGERQMANDNTELGRFDLVGIPPAPRGVPQIEVTFDIDANGIVHVTAKDKATGKEQKIQITAKTKLSEAEIEKMVKEAEKYAEEDKKRREEAELLNGANTLLYSTEKSLKDYGDKVSAADKEAMEKELTVLRDAIKDKNHDKIKSSMEDLQKVSHKLAEEMYKATANQGQAQAGGQAEGPNPEQADSGSAEPKPEKGKDDVIDADFKASSDK
jgi:molecular chaperone DnaK